MFARTHRASRVHTQPGPTLHRGLNTLVQARLLAPTQRARIPTHPALRPCAPLTILAAGRSGWAAHCGSSRAGRTCRRGNNGCFVCLRWEGVGVGGLTRWVGLAASGSPKSAPTRIMSTKVATLCSGSPVDPASDDPRPSATSSHPWRANAATRERISQGGSGEFVFSHPVKLQLHLPWAAGGRCGCARKHAQNSFVMPHAHSPVCAHALHPPAPWGMHTLWEHLQRWRVHGSEWARLRARTGEGAQIACALGEQSATRVEGVCLLNPGAGGCAGACSMRASARSRTRVCPFCVHACTASPLPHAWWPTICVRHTQRNAYCCPHAVPHAWWPTSKPGAARAMYTYRCLLPLQRPSWLRERVSAPAAALAVVVSRRWL